MWSIRDNKKLMKTSHVLSVFMSAKKTEITIYIVLHYPIKTLITLRHLVFTLHATVLNNEVGTGKSGLFEGVSGPKNNLPTALKWSPAFT